MLLDLKQNEKWKNTDLFFRFVWRFQTVTDLYSAVSSLLLWTAGGAAASTTTEMSWIQTCDMNPISVLNWLSAALVTTFIKHPSLVMNQENENWDYFFSMTTPFLALYLISKHYLRSQQRWKIICRHSVCELLSSGFIKTWNKHVSLHLVFSVLPHQTWKSDFLPLEEEEEEQRFVNGQRREKMKKDQRMFQ